MLQAHLPLVRHPEYDRFLEERWFFEALSETYLPLLRELRTLEREQVPFRLAMSFSPTLSFMLTDDFLLDRYRAHLERSLHLAERELDRTADLVPFRRNVEMYQNLLEQNLVDLDDIYGGKILRGFDYFSKKGWIEMLATSATHAFLPNYRNYPEIVRAQIELGIDQFHAAFGTAATGFWLPECGYYEGLDDILVRMGVEYTVGASHSVLLGSRVPRNGLYAPVRTRAGLAVFPRDAYTAQWVWSSEHGYPADPSYREFYRDIGHDLPLDYIGPFVQDGEVRIDTGFKYYAITGDTDDKMPYEPDRARERVREHARDFLERQTAHTERLKREIEAEPVIMSPYDAELFGHWWFEGPQWIGDLFRVAQEMCENGDSCITMTTPAAYLRGGDTLQVLEPGYSSWGSRGYGEVWLDGSNDWIYRHTHMAIERMGELIARFPSETGLKKRALDQAAREVLLSQASDWPFILNAQTVVPYARRRIKEHLHNFTRIYEELSRGNVGTEWLTTLEKKTPIFPNLDYTVLRLHASDTMRRVLI